MLGDLFGGKVVNIGHCVRGIWILCCLFRWHSFIFFISLFPSLSPVLLLLVGFVGWMDGCMNSIVSNMKKKYTYKKIENNNNKKKNGSYAGPQRARSGCGVFPLLLVISGQRSRGLKPCRGVKADWGPCQPHPPPPHLHPHLTLTFLCFSLPPPPPPYFLSHPISVLTGLTHPIFANISQCPRANGQTARRILPLSLCKQFPNNAQFVIPEQIGCPILAGFDGLRPR